ncbi:MAG: hypothetical protein ABWY45_24360 [Mycobacterium sp.]
MGDTVTDFLAALAPTVRAVTADVVGAVQNCADFDVAVKWRQLTFALDGDFDHWVCAVAASRDRVELKLHFGSLLTDPAQVFVTDSSKFVRKLRFQTSPEPTLIADYVTRAVRALPEFRRVWQNR